MKNIVLLLSVSITLIKATAQNNRPWNGRQCAVVLTYDDGLNVDLTNVVPALDSFGLKGTFYICDYFNGLHAQIPKWRAAAAKGHELANHTVWHPCEGGRAGREFVKPDYDLMTYTVRRMTDEARAMNNILTAIDGREERTFAYPCGDTKIHDTAYINGLKGDFIAARGVKPEMLSIDKIDLYNIGCYTVNGQTGEQLIDLVKKAAAGQSLLVFLFHGVGGEHSLNVSLPAHSRLLRYLKQQEKDVWVTTALTAAKCIKDFQTPKK